MMTVHSYRTNVHGSILMLRIGKSRHVPSKGCTDHHERLYKVSHHCTSVKVQDGWLSSVGAPDEYDTKGSPSIMEQ